MSAWTKLESGDIAAIGLKDTRSDYKRHNKHLALYASIENFHSSSKKSEKKNNDVTLTTGGSNAVPEVPRLRVRLPRSSRRMLSPPTPTARR